MAIGEIAIGAVVHQERAAIARDRRKTLDLLARIADAQRIVGIDEIDDGRSLIDMSLQRLGRQPIIASWIMDRNLDHFRALLAREQARPFPGRIGGRQRRAGLAARAADHGQRVDTALRHQRFGIRRAEIGDDGAAQRLEAQRRGVSVELARLDRAQHRFAHRRVALDVVGVLAEPVEPRRRREFVEIAVADQRGGLRPRH
jgi:hypothetical protein